MSQRSLQATTKSGVLSEETLQDRNASFICSFDSINLEYLENGFGGKETYEDFENLIVQQSQMKVLPLTLRRSRKYSCCQHTKNPIEALPGFEIQKVDEDQREAEQGLGLLANVNQLILPNQILKEENKCHQESVFVRKELRGWKKNTNIPKFITRIFIKYFKEYAKENEQTLLDHHNKVTQNLLSRNSNRFSISDVLSLLRDETEDETIRKRNQQILSKIIQQKFKTQIMQNSYVQRNRKTYMMGLKVYAIRCRSKTLTERVQTL